MQKNLTDTPSRRKLIVSAKDWDGTYDPAKQVYKFQVYPKLLTVILNRPWSPIIWRGGYRKAEWFLSSDWLALDFDKNELDIDQAVKTFADYQYIIATTKSHTPTNHCFRVCIPWARTITDVHEFEYNLRKNAEFYGSDLNALSAGRFFWPSKEIYKINLDGEFMEVMTEPPYEKARRKLRIARALRPTTDVSDRAKAFLGRGELLEDGRNCTIRDISRDLIRAGWTFDDIVEAINQAPFDRTGFDGPGDDIERIVRNSFKYVERKRNEQRQIP